MKKQIRHSFVLGLMLLTALVSLIPTSVFAAGNSMYLTPATGSNQPGNIFTVSVDGFVAASWFGTNSASGTVTFPAGLLKVNSVSTTGTTFSGSGTVTPNNTNGTITYSGATPWWTSANNQTVHLFTITFQSLAAGTAGVNFSSAQYNSGSAATTGGTYTISNPPPPPPPPAPSPTPAPTSTPKPTTAPKPSPKVTPKVIAPVITPVTTPTPEETPDPIVESDGGLKIENVKVTANRQENSISWSLNNDKASPVLTYGTTKSKQEDAVVTKQENGTYATAIDDLKLGTLYYFTIKAVTPDNLQGATYIGTFTTRGYPVQLTIKQNDLLLPGAKVKIGERSFVANKNAIISAELGDGKYEAAITPPGSNEAQSATFTVAKKSIPSSGNPDLQVFTLNVTTVGTTSGLNGSLVLPIIGGIAALIIAGAALIGFIILRRRQPAEETQGVDTDLLAASYGNVVEEHLGNTPMPNLETAGAATVQYAPEAAPQPSDMPAPEQLPPEQYIQQPMTADTAQTTIPVPEVVATNVAAQSPTTDQFDPSGLPLPPEGPAYIDPSALPPAQPATDQYSEAEQLAPEIAQVEAAEQIQDDEPSAVYDESTGELDIIHHHEHAHETVQEAPPVASVTVATPQEPASASEISAPAPEATAYIPEPTDVPVQEVTPVIEPAAPAYDLAAYPDDQPQAPAPQPPLTVAQ